MRKIERLVREHLRTIQALEPLYPLIDDIAERMIERLANGSCILWAGNGGSAADSQHLASELVGRFEHARRGLASIALTTDTSALTAIGNDSGFEEVFARQVEAIGRPGDILVGISTSGTSSNVLRAVERARTRGLTTIGLSGRGGGKLKDIADACLVVPADNTARIQEAHILIGHILCDLVEERFVNLESRARCAE